MTEQIHRTTPIAETVQGIPGYPSSLRIFQKRASRYWQASARLGGVRKTASLKTE